MDYEHYRLGSPRRPSGMGAFFDYGLAVTRFYRPKIARKTSPQPPPPQPPQPPQGAEERWEGEGGTSAPGREGASGPAILAITATMWRLPFQIPRA